MASIPESPKDQFLFFVDNPIVAGEPGGKAIIKGFLALVAPVVGGDSAASSAMAFKPSANRNRALELAAEMLAE